MHFFYYNFTEDQKYYINLVLKLYYDSKKDIMNMLQIELENEKNLIQRAIKPCTIRRDHPKPIPEKVNKIKI